MKMQNSKFKVLIFELNNQISRYNNQTMTNNQIQITKQHA